MGSIIGSAVGSLLGGVLVSFILWKLLYFINIKTRSYLSLLFPFFILITWWSGSSHNVAAGNSLVNCGTYFLGWLIVFRTKATFLELKKYMVVTFVMYLPVALSFSYYKNIRDNYNNFSWVMKDNYSKLLEKEDIEITEEIGKALDQYSKCIIEETGLRKCEKISAAFSYHFHDQCFAFLKDPENITLVMSAKDKCQKRHLR